jgi:hypothetical protein
MDDAGIVSHVDSAVHQDRAPVDIAEGCDQRRLTEATVNETHQSVSALPVGWVATRNTPGC